MQATDLVRVNKRLPRFGSGRRFSKPKVLNRTRPSTMTKQRGAPAPGGCHLISKPAQFRVDPRLAKLLGESYRSTEQAIKELIDNAWDADSEHVWITLPEPLTINPIVIQDDGSGMTEREVRYEYLNIANDRRTRRGELTLDKKRAVKGRKGIGKFAGLVAADVMEVCTQCRGDSTSLDFHGNKQD